MVTFHSFCIGMKRSTVIFEPVLHINDLWRVSDLTTFTQLVKRTRHFFFSLQSIIILSFSSYDIIASNGAVITCRVFDFSFSKIAVILYAP